MGNFLRGAARAGIVVLAVACSHTFANDSVTPEEEYKKLVHVRDDISPLAANPFGESVSLYDGSLSFTQTDISLSGTGPAIQLTRTFSVTGIEEREGRADRAFGDWELNIPRISTITAALQVARPWVVQTTNDYARCTHFGPPPSVAASNGGSEWEPKTWWHGYQLIVPGAGSQDLLHRVAQNTLSPQMAGKTFSIVTKQNWMVSCLPNTDNDPGEGFYAVAPDGSKYTFNHIAYSWASMMTRPIGSTTFGAIRLDRRLMTASSADMMTDAMRMALVATPAVAQDDFVRRSKADMLVTRVEDRFGNFVTYNYSGNDLTSIVASDGRRIDLTYIAGTHHVLTASVTTAGGSRTWSYQYDADAFPTLTRVVQPDGAAWSFVSGGLASAHEIELGGTCDIPPKLWDATFTGTMTHPSGLSATFVVKPLMRGRSAVPKECIGQPTVTGDGPFAVIPRVYFPYVLVSKTFSGAGLLGTQTWTYNYSPPNQSWLSDCASSCTSTVWTDVVDPDSHTTRYTYSNRFDATEGQLLSTSMYSGAAGSSLLKQENYVYASAGAWPNPYGLLMQPGMNMQSAQIASPLSKKILGVDGDTYIWEALSFDAFTQPTVVTRSSSANAVGFREGTSYLNDLPHWVLGLPLETTNGDTGEVIRKTDYNLAAVTPSERYAFGQPLMSYVFDGGGNLASFTDGNSHTTNLSNYKRGIPQTIGFPDGTSESIVVDDFGQITSVTNQAGSATSYSYDPIGRVQQISYPAGDSVAWAPKQFFYAFVPSAERGIPGNHWRRFVVQGAKTQVTYFDAMLRPILSGQYRSSDGGLQTSLRTDYDWRGNPTFQSYPTDGAGDIFSIGTGISTVYDALGRATQSRQLFTELGTLTTTTAYLSGARKQVTDPKGGVTTTSYQVFDEPSYDNVIQVQAPESVLQTITRDLYGNPLSITQGGAGASVTKTMVYDSFHRLCRTTEPESGSEVMTYDAANNLAWSASGVTISGTGCGQEQVAATAQTTRSYDAMNRVTGIVYPAGTVATTLTYTATGKPRTTTAGSVLWTYGYNKLDMLTGETLSVDGFNWPIGYGYDANGALAATVYPDGKAVNYIPDAMGRPTQAGAYASAATYYPDGDLRQFNYGNGASYVATKNGRNLLSNFSFGQGATVAVSEDMAYDANANITQITDLTNNGQRTKVLGYDMLNRLTSATASNLWGTESYIYDTLNNIRSLTTAGATNTYNYDGTNRLASVTNGATTVNSFQYDTRGNVTAKNNVPLVFDQANRLTSITGFDSYTYDAEGRRVKKAPVSGPVTYYAYSQAGQLLWQYDPSTTNATDYIYLGKKMVANTVNLPIPATAPSLSGPATGVVNVVYTLNWTAVPGATTYAVQEQVNGAAFNLASNVSALTFSTHHTGPAFFGYRVQACNSSGCGPWSNIVTVHALPLSNTPAAPSSATALLAGDLSSISISWPTTANTTSYTVQEQANGGSWMGVYSGTSLSTVLANPADGTYRFQVEACNASGCGDWTPTNVVTVILIPPAPAAISVPATSTGNIAIGWSAAKYATSYSLEQSINGAGAFSAIYSGPALSFAYSVGTTATYYYRVRACSTDGCGGYGPIASSVITIPPANAPPINVAGTSNNGCYTVNWTGVPGATSFTMQEQVNGGGWTTIANNGSGALPICGKVNGTYGYRVQGCNAGGCGPFSVTVSVVVALLPSTPSSFRTTLLSPLSKGRYNASWAAVAYATSYDVEQTLPGGLPEFIYSGTGTGYLGIVIGTNGTVLFRVRACNAVGCSAWSPYYDEIFVSG